MSEEKSYLASDLTTELQLPRSTINDWLTRFAAYLPSESRGKRRAYSEAALTVLREIAAWRDEGKSAYEIEQALSARYGIRPEVTMPEDQPQSQDAGDAASGAADGSVLPALRRPMAEVQQQIASQFDRLSNLMEEMQKVQKKSDRKVRVSMFFCVILFAAGIAAAAGAGVFGWREYQKKECSAATQRQAITLQQSAASDRLGKLTSAQQEMTRQLAALREENLRLSQEKERQLAEQEKRHAATLEKERAKHAAEYRELRQNLAMEVTAAKSASEAALKAQKEKYEAKLAALNAERDALTRQKTALEQTVQKMERDHRATLKAEAQKNADLFRQCKNLVESNKFLNEQREQEQARNAKELQFLRKKVAELQQENLKQALPTNPPEQKR